MKKNRLILVFLVFVLVVVSCGENKVQDQTNLKQDVKATMANITSKPSITFQTISAKLANMPRYNFYAIRDPFYTPLIKTEVKQVKPKKQKPSPTERYELDKYKLIGIMTNKKIKSAIFEDPEGKGWVVKEGAPIGQEDARIKRISAEGVYIEEVIIDDKGKEKKNEIFIPIKKVR
ncbi:MAG: pilus assembly protein PilP [Proteobacteria bacterium]|nr:pilus assembly protein PilP [Pseudomonadota bacterium]